MKLLSIFLILLFWSVNSSATFRLNPMRATLNEEISLYASNVNCQGLSPLIQGPVLENGQITVKLFDPPPGPIASPCARHPNIRLPLTSLLDLGPGEHTVVIEAYEDIEATELNESVTQTISISSDDFKLTPALTGSWFNRDESGHGFTIELLADGHILLYWVTFDQDGAPLWLFGQGTYGLNTADLTLYTVDGGVFPPDWNAELVTQSEWGTAVMMFQNCTQMEFAWDANDANTYSGSTPLSRLSPESGAPCTDNSDSVLATSNIIFEFTEAVPEPHPVINAFPSDYIRMDEDSFGWTAEMQQLPTEISEGNALRLQISEAETGPKRFLVSGRFAQQPNLEYHPFGLVPSFAVDVEVIFASRLNTLCTDWKLGVGINRHRPGQVEIGESKVVRTHASGNRVAGIELGVLGKKGMTADCQAGTWGVNTLSISGDQLLVPQSSLEYVFLELDTGRNEGLDIYIIDVIASLRPVR